ncbi:MAG: Hsp20/alpha crystallin family protein [candidate division Zixibacteria bacterium]|jgi:HSP20 family protein|nr:Hsp20/alpha crystallin family protein [candidate division Zixibacteria bacterium]
MTTLMQTQRNGLSRMIDDMFGDFGLTTVVSRRALNGYQPSVNIIESDNDVRLVFEAPGMKKEDFRVVIKDGNLVVTGERSFVIDDQKDRVVHREFGDSRFTRSFTLSDLIDTDSVKADYSQGLLTVTLAKREEARPREIEISVN